MRLTFKILLAAAGVALALPGGAFAAEGEVELLEKRWPTEGVFGQFDRDKLQRGFQVYQNVCQACHGLNYVAFRNLEMLGYSEEEIQAVAAQYTVTDGPDDLGDMFEREAIPADRFPPPFPNEKAAAAANGGKAPPDLSLMAKARGGGEDYIYSLMLGYEDPPEGVEVAPGTYYNAYYPGHAIAMPPILMDDIVEYADGTPATMEQMASDVTHFLTFTAEPNLEARKKTGVMAMIFLFAFTAIFYAYKRKIWSDVKK